MQIKRKIAVVITHRAPYGRLRGVMRAIKAHPSLELQVIVGVPLGLKSFFFSLRHSTFASWRAALPWALRARLMTLWRRGDARHELLAKLAMDDGFTIDRYLPMYLEGGDLETMLKIQGNVLYELPPILKDLKPDVLLVHADRFEMLPVAMVGATLNIPVAHTQGGDVSGTIDEVIRHAITKLAHLHFPTSEASRTRLIQMGEDPAYVFMTGCPTIDVLAKLDLSTAGLYERVGQGYGDRIDFDKPFVLMLQHPVTTEYERSREHMESLLAAVREAHMPTLLFWPNIDGGTDGASAAVRAFLKDHGLPALSVYKTFNSDDFYRALSACAVAVGNSSSFIREGSYLGVPAVLVGTRQQQRERGENIAEAGYTKEEISAAIKKQIAHGKYPQSLMYGDGQAGKRIADTLATVVLPNTQKTFHSPSVHG